MTATIVRCPSQDGRLACVECRRPATRLVIESQLFWGAAVCDDPRHEDTALRAHALTQRLLADAEGMSVHWDDLVALAAGTEQDR